MSWIRNTNAHEACWDGEEDPYLEAGWPDDGTWGSMTWKEQDPDPKPDPDPLVGGIDPRIWIRIRIHTKMSCIRNTDAHEACWDGEEDPYLEAGSPDDGTWGSMTWKKQDPDPKPDPDQLVEGMDPRIWIRIHTKMSGIRNTAAHEPWWDGEEDPYLEAGSPDDGTWGSMTWKKQDPDPKPDPDPLVAGMDPRIWIRIRIHTKCHASLPRGRLSGWRDMRRIRNRLCLTSSARMITAQLGNWLHD